MNHRSVRHKMISAVAVLALLGGVAACSDSSESGSTTPAANTPAPATSAAPEATPAESSESTDPTSEASSEAAPASSSSSAPAEPPKQLTLREGFAGAALSPSTGMYTSLPQALGFWAEEGLTVDIQRVDGTATALSAMAGGQLDLSIVSGEPVVQANNEGGSFVIPYSLGQRGIVTTTVLADSAVQSLADLGGTTMGVPSLASGAVTFAQAALTDAGVDINTVTFAAVGTGAQAAAALLSGQVASLSDTDTAVAAYESAGAVVRILDSPLRDKLVLGIVAACTKEYMAADPDAITAWGRGVAKATLWMAAHPEDAVRLHYQVYPEERPDGTDEEIIALGVKQITARLENVIPADTATDFGSLTDEQLDAVVSFMVSNGVIPAAVEPSSFYDPSLISDINDFDRAAAEATPAPAG